MNVIRLTFLTLFAILSLQIHVGAARSKTETESIIKSLNQELSKATSPSDSITILYNLFDISPQRDKPAIGEQIYVTATNNHDNEAVLDILRNLSNLYLKNDSLQTILINRVDLLPETKQQAATKTFLVLSRAATRASLSSEEDRQAYLLRILNEYQSADDSRTLLQRIEQLFKVCIYLGASTQGTLLGGYMDQLGELIDQLPDGYEPLRNMYYVQADIIYGNINEPAKALNASSRLLDIIKGLEDDYHKRGRIYRSYDRYYYLIYRRMLSNYASLSNDKVDSYYKQIKELVKNNSDLSADLANNERVEVYYLMSKGRYDEALAILKRQIDNPKQVQYIRRMLEEMVTAATRVGDRDALLTASTRLNDYLQKYIELNANEHYNELKILYDINEIKAHSAMLESKHRKDSQEWTAIFITMSIVILIILIVSVVVLFKSYRRSKHLAADLKKTNSLLVAESDSLKETQERLIIARNEAQAANKQKSDFIHNMSHEVQAPLNAIEEYTQLIVDFVDDNSRKYLQKYVQVVLLSCDMLKTLINDVFDLAALENGNMNVKLNDVSLTSLCTMPLESVRGRLNNGVELVFDAPDQTTLVHTDPTRVEQVLINLLSNAAKFTKKGKITLSCSISPDGNDAVFSVSDTGIGIPDGKEDIIFNRFEKLDPYTTGGGLGLHICKLIACLLGGKVYVDKSYQRPGAKFIFTIPVNGQQRRNK